MTATQQKDIERLIEDIVLEAPTEEQAMVDALYRYFSSGEVYGHFLRALLSNNFAEAVTRADAHNSEFIYEWAIWLWNSVPQRAWGSEDIVQEFTGLGEQ
jgi:hypothetical protein